MRAEVTGVEVPKNDEHEIDFDAAVVAAATKRITNKDCLRVKRNLRVCGNEIVDGNLAVGGNEAIAGSLAVAENVAIGGNLVVTGTLVASDIISTGSLCAEFIFLCPPVTTPTPGIPGLGGALAYGEVASIVGEANATVTLAANSAAPATFSYTGPLAGITTHETNGIVDGLILGSAGLYLFMYEISELIGVNLFSNVIALTATNSQIPASAFETIAVAGLEASTGQINGFVLSRQPAEALIQLVNPGVNVITTGTGTGVNAKLTALRLA